MPGRPSAIKINLNEQTRMVLHGWIQRQKTPFGLVKRAQAILSLSQGHSFIATAKHVGLTERHVHSWARRFVEQGPAGLYNRPRSGRKPLFEPSVALYAVKLACEQPDQHGRSLSEVGIVERSHANWWPMESCRQSLLKPYGASSTLIISNPGGITSGSPPG